MNILVTVDYAMCPESLQALERLGQLTYLQYFVQAIHGKAASPTPGELGRDAIALCQAIEKSGQTGRPVKVKRF